MAAGLLLVLLQLASPAAAQLQAAMSLPKSGCTAVPVGCYSDCLGGARGVGVNSRTLSVGVSGCCNEDQDAPGGCKSCPKACLNAGMVAQCPASGHECPVCTTKDLDQMYCADLCAEMFGGEGYAGVEAGAQCFCGAAISPAAKLNDGTHKCDNPCAGKPGSVCGGNCAIDIVKIECGVAWGLPLILVLGLGAVFYVSGGVAYNHKVGGQPLGPAALPHQEFWLELAGLVRDGAKFAADKTAAELQARGVMGGGAGPGPAAAAADGQPELETPLAAGEAASTKSGSSEAEPAPAAAAAAASSSSDDHLVE
eukprot:SAG22_NODE_11_length_35583_cov_107.128790_34_plen_310_part_00